MNDLPRDLSEASVRTPSRFHLIWLVPIVAAGLAIYLGWKTLSSEGPIISIILHSGQGLTAGQTKVMHNAVAIGTVESVQLSDDFQQVVARVRMDRKTTPLLTDHARFWVVRPHLSPTDLSGLQTILSGQYIDMDPGVPGGKPERQFHALEQPPIPTDLPGETFTLQASSLGWLQPGAPVFYRDIKVGHMIDYQENGVGKPIIMHVFIHAPYDRNVRAATHFWNSSGLTASFGPSGLHVAVESLEALLAGGINFANFEDAAQSPPATFETKFPLYNSFDEAQNAGFRDNYHFVAYFKQSISGLEPGSAVKLYGLRVGTVTGTELQLDLATGGPRVRVTFDVQPRRILPAQQIPAKNPLDDTRRLVALGMRARIDTSNLVTGQEDIGLDMLPDAPPAEVRTEATMIVVPSQSGGLQGLTDALGEIVAKLNKMPLEQLGTNANDLIGSLHQVATTADSDLKSIQTELPELSKDLDTTLRRADRLLTSIQQGYGDGSDTHEDLRKMTTEATETLRSLRELTNSLERQPQSVLWGRR